MITFSPSDMNGGKSVYTDVIQVAALPGKLFVSRCQTPCICSFIVYTIPRKSALIAIKSKPIRRRVDIRVIFDIISVLG